MNLPTDVIVIATVGRLPMIFSGQLEASTPFYLGEKRIYERSKTDF